MVSGFKSTSFTKILVFGDLAIFQVLFFCFCHISNLLGSIYRFTGVHRKARVNSFFFREWMVVLTASTRFSGRI